MKLLNYIGISRINSDPEVFNRAYQLAKKVKHLNCDTQMAISLYFNYCSQIHSAGWLFPEYRNAGQLFRRILSIRQENITIF